MVISALSVDMLPAAERVLALVQVEFDHCLVIKDIRIVKAGDNLIVAMPSRKKQIPCGNCGQRNVLGSAFCGQCGGQLPADKTLARRIHSDVAHPVNAAFRNYLVQEIFREFERKSKIFGG
jgi:DNA-binding cell septation regulator SpoVG